MVHAENGDVVELQAKLLAEGNTDRKHTPIRARRKSRAKRPTALS
jgi:hypothetical protein